MKILKLKQVNMNHPASPSRGSGANHEPTALLKEIQEATADWTEGRSWAELSERPTIPPDLASLWSALGDRATKGPPARLSCAYYTWRFGVPAAAHVGVNFS